MFCPACNGRVIHCGQIPVILPKLRLKRLSDVLTCTTCTATTEVDNSTGKLIDYRPLTVSHLYVPYCGQERKVTAVSLRGGSSLYQGRES